MRKFVFWGLIAITVVAGMDIVQYVQSSQEESQAVSVQKAAAVMSNGLTAE